MFHIMFDAWYMYLNYACIIVCVCACACVCVCVCMFGGLISYTVSHYLLVGTPGNGY